MRFLSMVRIDENSGKAPSEQLMNDMGKLIDEMFKAGVLIDTGGLKSRRKASGSSSRAVRPA